MNDEHLSPIVSCLFSRLQLLVPSHIQITILTILSTNGSHTRHMGDLRTVATVKWIVKVPPFKIMNYKKVK